MSQFHEVFVNNAMNLANDYESRISKLENDVKLLKSIIETMYIDSYRFGYDVKSILYISLEDEDININRCKMDSIDICKQCNVLFKKDKGHSH